jgi:hypothetical protein
MHKCESCRRSDEHVRFIYLCIRMRVRAEFLRWADEFLLGVHMEERPFGGLISARKRFSEGKQANLFIGSV